MDHNYEDRSINKLQNSIISVIFEVWKNPKIRFVRNFMLNTSCELYYDDVTVTSFIDIKCGNVAVQRIRNKISNILLFVFCGQKPAYMPLFTLNCVQCIVTSVLRNQQYIAWCNKFTNSPNTEFCKKVSKYVAKQNVDFYSASTS